MQSIDHIIEEILDYQVDGIIAASVSMSSGLSERCRSAGIPMVLFNRSQDDPAMSVVTSDNLKGGKKVANYFVETGHQKIGFITGWEGASTQRDREAGFVEALNDHGIKLHSRRIGNFVLDEAKKATKSMFSKDPPTAVFVANDHMAFAVLDTLRFELGLKVPTEVSVIGYDDVPAASWPAYSLTTVRQPVNRMVQETIATLKSKIDNPNAAVRKVKIDGPLVIRNSSRKSKRCDE